MAMMVIGVDAHKATHTAAAVRHPSAELLGELTVSARQAGHERLLAWASDLDEERLWAIEDCRNMSGGLERMLLGAGERVVRVPPKLMAAQRRTARTFAKSDPIDALAVARAAMREPDLPAATLPGIAQEIGLLVDHRDDLVADAAAHQRRLRWHLHELDPDLSLRPLALTSAINLQRVERCLSRLPQGVQVRICRELVARIGELTRRARELARELDQLVRQTNPGLLEIPGCGTLCAAAIIAEVGGIERFRNEAQLAAYAGVAPLDASSGRQRRHRLNRTGNRRLNRALYLIAVTQIRIHPPAIAYLARRRAEGKTTREALRALKRHLARTVFNTLKKEVVLT